MNEIKEYIAQSKEMAEEIQKAFVAVTILTVLFLIMTIVIGFKHIELGIAYGELQEEKEKLEGTIEMQKSMISDLEANCKDLYIEIENLKFGGNE